MAFRGTGRDSQTPPPDIGTGMAMHLLARTEPPRQALTMVRQTTDQRASESFLGNLEDVDHLP